MLDLSTVGRTAPAESATAPISAFWIAGIDAASAIGFSPSVVRTILRFWTLKSAGRTTTRSSVLSLSICRAVEMSDTDLSSTIPGWPSSADSSLEATTEPAGPVDSLTMAMRALVDCELLRTQPRSAMIARGATNSRASERGSRRNWATMRRTTAATRSGLIVPAPAPGRGGPPLTGLRNSRTPFRDSPSRPGCAARPASPAPERARP